MPIIIQNFGTMSILVFRLIFGRLNMSFLAGGLAVFVVFTFAILIAIPLLVSLVVSVALAHTI